MKHTPLFFASALLAIFLLESCSKYEDGPGLSLRSRTDRVTGNWNISNAEVDGQSIMSFYNTFELRIQEDNSFRQTTSILTGSEETVDGTWRFAENDEVLQIEYDNSVRLDFEILRLTNSELWVTFEASAFNLGFDDEVITNQPLINVRLEFTKQDS